MGIQILGYRADVTSRANRNPGSIPLTINSNDELIRISYRDLSYNNRAQCCFFNYATE
jgi:hypothetical protein